VRTGLVSIWELKVSLSPAITDSGMASLRDRVREAVDREVMGSVVPSPFLWTTQGAALTVRTEGSPFPLLEIVEWVLENCDPGPKGFGLETKRVAPLRKMEGWQGYGRD